jgi:hypothetical protein
LKLKRLLTDDRRTLLVIGGIAALAFAAYAAVTAVQARSDLQAYNRSHACTATVHTDCWSTWSGIVTRKFWDPQSQGPATPTVVMTGLHGRQRRQLALASDADYDVVPVGEPQRLVMFRGTTIGIDDGAQMLPTTDWFGYAEHEHTAWALAAGLFGFGLFLAAFLLPPPGRRPLTLPPTCIAFLMSGCMLLLAWIWTQWFDLALVVAGVTALAAFMVPVIGRRLVLPLLRRSALRRASTRGR